MKHPRELCIQVDVGHCRGESAKTNFPISDYENEIESLKNANYDILVADLRAEVPFFPSLIIPPIPATAVVADIVSLNETSCRDHCRHNAILMRQGTAVRTAIQDSNDLTSNPLVNT